MSLIAKFKSGKSVTDGLVIEFVDLNGEIVKITTGNGGQSKEKVSTVPDKIKNMIKVK